MPQMLQPFLHDLVPVLAAPTQVWSRRDAQIDGTGTQGLLHADVRVISVLEVLVDGGPGEHIATWLDDDGLHTSTLLRQLATGRVGPDPSVRLDRHRQVAPGRLREELVVSTVLTDPTSAVLTVRLEADLASTEEIKQGVPCAPRPIRVVDGAASWGNGEVTARLSASGAEVVLGRDDVTLRWAVTIPARGDVRVGFEVEVSDRGGVVAAAPPVLDGLRARLHETLALAPAAVAADRRLRPWIEQSLSDLARLEMVRPEFSDEVFYAAGAPWYFTLFGRDSLLAARMMLPVDQRPALGTLRTLARLQGTSSDDATAEQPGKIMHELRRAGTSFLPPLYYGTIDATPLWIALLVEVWRFGLDSELVRDLLPNLRAAVDWLTNYGDADGDGFLEYLDASGRGLTNQGWKDSADSVRFADGTIAAGPMALCEVQGYAYEAAIGAADLLEAHGESGADELRGWAGALADRFRDQFWVESRGHRFPAMALDGQKRPVDALTSNIGHLLGTGLLSAAEERSVAELVSGPELDSGLGLRTMSIADGGYSPLSYHCGSVWPHDTAIVIMGLVRSGLTSYAGGLVEGMISAATAFDQRFPELFSGEGRPVPYPASCRPQAWSAAAVVPTLQALATLTS